MEGASYLPMGTSEALKVNPSIDVRPQDNVSNLQSIKLDKVKNTPKVKEEEDSVGIEEEKKEGASGPHVQKPTPS